MFSKLLLTLPCSASYVIIILLQYNNKSFYNIAKKYTKYNLVSERISIIIFREERTFLKTCDANAHTRVHSAYKRCW